MVFERVNSFRTNTMCRQANQLSTTRLLKLIF